MSAAATPPGYTVTGIDVSVFQGSVDWQAVKASGASFTYVRASEQANIPDPNFASNYAGAKAVGLSVGAYHRAKPDASSGKAQADYFVSHAGFANDGSTLPPVVDMEWPRAGWTSPTGQPLDSCYNLSAAQIVGWTRAFAAEVTVRTGRLPVIYTSTSWWNLCTGSDSTFAQNLLWVARYSTSPLPLPAGWTRFAFWQYSNQGQLPNGSAVDQDVFSGKSAALAWLARGTPAALTTWKGAGAQHIAYLSADGHARELYQSLAGGTWKQNDLTAAAAAPAAVPGTALTSWVDPTYQHLGYFSADGHVRELYFPLGGGRWKHSDLTAAAGASAAADGSDIASWVGSGAQHVAYTAPDRHIRELYRPLGGGVWKQNDLTAAAAAPAAVPGAALTSWVDPTYQHLGYFSADGHVRELYFPLGGGRWKQNDLTAAASAPAPVAGSALTSWVGAGAQHVAHFSADGHARELYFQFNAGRWKQNDLTTAAGAPPSLPGSALTSWIDSTYQHVAYFTSDRHARELYFPLGGGTWRQNDLTAAAGAPAAVPGSDVSSWVAIGAQHVVYLSADGHVRDLARPLGGGAWTQRDVTAVAGAPPALTATALAG